MYEALAVDPEPWEDLFASELDRLLRLCDANPRSERLFQVLDCFAFLERTASERLLAAIAHRLVAAAESPHGSVRRLAANLLGGVDLARHPAARECLERMLTDSDWRVRSFAHSSLEGQELVPAGFELRLLDRLRQRSSSATSYV